MKAPRVDPTPITKDEEKAQELEKKKENYFWMLDKGLKKRHQSCQVNGYYSDMVHFNRVKKEVIES